MSLRLAAVALLVVGLSPALSAGNPDIVFRAFTPDVGNELFHLDGKTGEITRLNGPLVEDGDVGNYSVGPRGRSVVYRADQEVEGVQELYYVSLSKKSLKDPQPIKISAPVAPAGDVLTGFRYGPRGRQIVYRARNGDTGSEELFHVSLTKKNLKDVRQTRLNGALVDGGNVEEFLMGPRGRQVVYLADQETQFTDELFHVSLSRKNLQDPQQTKISGELVEGGEVDDDFQLDTRGRHVVFVADAATDGVDEIFHASLSKKALKDPTTTRLNGPVSEFAMVQEDFQIGPRGRQVVFEADQDPDEFDEVCALFHVSLSATNLKDPQPTRLSGEPVEGADGVGDDPSFGPRGRQLVYVSDEHDADDADLYHVRLSKRNLKDVQRTRLTDALAEDRDAEDPVIGPKGRQVVFYVDPDDGPRELFHLGLSKKSLKTPQATRLSGPLVEDGEIDEFEIGPRGRQLVYVADQETDEQFELYHVSLSKKDLEEVSQTKLNQEFIPAGDVDEFDPFEFDRKGRQLVYLADAEVFTRNQLYGVALSRKNLKEVMRDTLTDLEFGLGNFELVP